MRTKDRTTSVPLALEQFTTEGQPFHLPRVGNAGGELTRNKTADKQNKGLVILSKMKDHRICFIHTRVGNAGYRLSSSLNSP